MVSMTQRTSSSRRNTGQLSEQEKQALREEMRKAAESMDGEFLKVDKAKASSR